MGSSGFSRSASLTTLPKFGCVSQTWWGRISILFYCFLLFFCDNGISLWLRWGLRVAYSTTWQPQSSIPVHPECCSSASDECLSNICSVFSCLAPEDCWNHNICLSTGETLRNNQQRVAGWVSLLVWCWAGNLLRAFTAIFFSSERGQRAPKVLGSRR